MASTLPMKDFYDFVKAIGESKSKQEEDRIIADEVSIGIHISTVTIRCVYKSVI